MNDAELADEIIARLNKLIENPDIRSDIGRLIEKRIACSKATLEHPTLQAVEDGFPAGYSSLGLLGS